MHNTRDTKCAGVDEVVTLVVSPFRDIVEKGTTAVDNAGGSQTMLRTAKSLIKEGECAVGYLEPICRKRYEEYGSSFVDTLKENDEISKYHEDLIALLWVFDDYTEAGGFAPGKYAQLQALSRAAAPKIYNILIRMKLEVRPQYNAQRALSQMSPPSSPLLFQPQSPQSPFAPSFVTGRVSAKAPPAADLPMDVSTVAGATMQLEQITERGLLHSDDDDDNIEGPGRPESPVDPHFLRANPRCQGPPGSSIARKPGASGLNLKQASPSSPKSPNSNAGQRLRRIEARPAMRLTEDAMAEELTMPLPLPRYLNRPSSPRGMVSDMPPRSPSECDMILGRDGYEPFQPRGVSGINLGTARPSAPVSPVGVDHALGGRSPVFGSPVSTIPVIEIDAGLIPLEEEELDRKPSARLLTKQNPTFNTFSSFYQYKGFCEGAKQVARGEIGVKKVQKPVQRTLSRIVAKCTGCPYELEFHQIESDVCKRDDGNLNKCGISYRLRFLQKSHLAAKKADDVHYGCVFCVHQGHTLENDDATVFFTTMALFSHLARHLRPLPKVPGIHVVEKVEMPDNMRNNYDIHFPNPPATHPAHGKQGEITGRPTGVATKESRRLYGQKRPSERSAALELALGARISGIEWPAKYKGVWMMAWHDGVFASVPTDMIALSAPAAEGEIRMGGANQVRAKTRWKFAPKDKGKSEWLKFDKAEAITNIGWPYRGHWCWSGTNAKGKWGIFPREFINPDTVEEMSPNLLNRVSSSNERGKTPSMLSRLSVRKSSAGPPSIAESTSSRETTSASFRIPLRPRRSNESSGGW